MKEKELLNEFILDAKEHISAITKGLIEIEKGSRDEQIINSIFRAAHTLKGNSATMGYEDISSLAHKIENILDEIRHGKKEIKSELIDEIFRYLDIIENKIENISDSKRTLDIDIMISPEEKMKSMRAYLIISRLSSVGEIISSSPSLNEIEEGKFDKGFALSLSTGKSKEEIESILKGIGGIERYEIRGKVKERCEIETEEIQCIRVGVDRLDSLLNLVGELVINKSRLFQLNSRLDIEELKHTLMEFERISKDLQDTVMSMRMVKLAYIFDRFPRMIRELARKEKKEVEFFVEGGDIEMDRGIIEKINEPLVHILRNCIDHGIETPEERERKNKPRKGRVMLSAKRAKSYVEIVIEDDGRGISIDKLRKKAIEKKFLSREEAEKMGDDEIIDIIFKPGFSSAEKVTAVSGRGVGLDVVKNAVSHLGGSIEVYSEEDKGTKIVIRLPPSMAIIKALLIEENNEIYAIPMKDVIEILDISNISIRRLAGEEIIVKGNATLPLFSLSRFLGSDDAEKKHKKIVVVERRGNKFALAVDRVIKQEEIVLKPLDSIISKIPVISGATILGSGRVVLILDVNNLNEVENET